MYHLMGRGHKKYGTFIIRVVRRQRGYTDHSVTMCVYVCGCVSVYVSTIKRKLLIRMT